MATVQQFRLPTPVETAREEKDNPWHPIDMTALPTKEIEELWATHQSLVEALSANEAEIEAALTPYVPAAPAGLELMFGFRYGGCAFGHIPPRKKGKGKFQLQPQPKGKK